MKHKKPVVEILAEGFRPAGDKITMDGVDISSSVTGYTIEASAGYARKVEIHVLGCKLGLEEVGADVVVDFGKNKYRLVRIEPEENADLGSPLSTAALRAKVQLP